VISASQTANPQEPLQQFLHNFPGKVLVLPERKENWYWLNTQEATKNQLIQNALKAIQQISENQTPGTTPSITPWMVVVYILAGLFTLELIFIALAALVNLFSI
jgi:hypothetical protein